MRKKIYLAIVQALQRAEAAKYIGLWNAAIDLSQGVTPADLPAVYVEFTPIEWEQRGGRVKVASLRLNLHILTAVLAPLAEGDSMPDEALEVFDTIDRIVSVVQGVNGPDFNGLQHVETLSDHAHGQIEHDVEGFVCAVEDRSAVRLQATLSTLLPGVERA